VAKVVHLIHSNMLTLILNQA